MCHYLSHLGSFGLQFSAQASLSIVFTMEGKLQNYINYYKESPHYIIDNGSYFNFNFVFSI